MRFLDRIFSILGGGCFIVTGTFILLFILAAWFVAIIT